MFTKYIVLPLACALHITIAAAQTRDPYAEDVKQEAFKHYLDHQHRVMDNIRFVYLAQGCAVLWGSGALEATGQLLVSLDQEATRIAQLDPKFNVLKGVAFNHALAKDVSQEGLTKSKEPGACSVFKNNPALVTQLREIMRVY